MASEVINDLSLVGVCESQIEDALVEETYADEIQVHEALSVDAGGDSKSDLDLVH